MRIALSSYTGMGAWFVLRLMAEGHKVDYLLSNPKYEDVLSGLIPKPKLAKPDERRHVLGYGFPSYRGYDLSIFDLTGKPRQAAASRAVVPTIGDGFFETNLEDDREYGIEAMEFCNITVPPYQRFATAGEAKAYVRKTDNRYVFKPFNTGASHQDTASTYVSKSAEDLIKAIDHVWETSGKPPFILQEYKSGDEMSVEGLFNGEDFYCVVGTIEEKKLLNDGKGPNTGCSGVLVFTLSKTSSIYQQTLARTIPLLRNAGFKGIIDINVILSDDKIYALEWGPRLGYLCCPVSSLMYGANYGEALLDTVSGKIPKERWEEQYGACVTVSIPPYPTEIRIPKAKGVPIEGLDPCSTEELCSFYLYDAKLKGEALETSGNYGFIGAPMGSGATIDEAFAKVEQKLHKLHIPNMQYRTDIKKRTYEKHCRLSVGS